MIKSSLVMTALSLVLRFIPIELLLRKTLSKLLDIGEDLLEDLLTQIEELVLKAEQQITDRGRGAEKFSLVKERIMAVYSDLSEWIVNLLIELVVANLKTKGVL